MDYNISAAYYYSLGTDYPYRPNFRATSSNGNYAYTTKYVSVEMLQYPNGYSSGWQTVAFELLDGAQAYSLRFYNKSPFSFETNVTLLINNLRWGL